jgi:nucleoside-diphosphate-sugar epimerase
VLKWQSGAVAVERNSGEFVTKVLVSGANGFVGRILCRELIASGYEVVGAVTQKAEITALPVSISVGKVGGQTDWRAALTDVFAVVHLAARVHVMRETQPEQAEAYLEVNLRGTMQLAKQAASMGVRRFVYLSSVKVNGERTYGQPFSADDPTVPEDAYARSKWEAEKALWEIADKDGLQVAVIRAPLIYGAGVKGNLRKLIRLIQRRVPLPFGAIGNRRSFLNIQNLTHFIGVLLKHPDAMGETYMLSDGVDLSTPELIRKLAAALGCRPYLFPLPVSLLRLIGMATGHEASIDRLCGDLQVDITKNHDLLGWSPPYGIDEGLIAMARQLDD